MGAEILVVFLLIPIALGLFDIVRIVQKKNANKHALLLLIGISILGYMAWSTARGGFHPMQGIIVGSFFYFPGYVVLWAILTGGASLYRGRAQ